MSAEQVRQLLSTLQHLRSTASKYLLDVSPPDPTAAELQSATQALTAALGNIHGPKLPDIMQEQADALWQGGCKLWVRVPPVMQSLVLLSLLRQQQQQQQHQHACMHRSNSAVSSMSTSSSNSKSCGLMP
jgi:hypothetical protein